MTDEVNVGRERNLNRRDYKIDLPGEVSCFLDAWEHITLILPLIRRQIFYTKVGTFV